MIIKERKTYDGSDIHKRFAYNYLRKNVSGLGDIVIFRGPMDVTTNLIDQEDLINNDYIWSDDAINIIWEIPNLCPLGAVAFQRLFNTAIAAFMADEFKFTISVDGDDMMFTDNTVDRSKNLGNNLKKGSVSITISKDNVALGHTGINIVAGTKAPVFAFSTNLNDDNVQLLMRVIEEIFYNLVKDLFVATTKVIA